MIPHEIRLGTIIGFRRWYLKGQRLYSSLRVRNTDYLEDRVWHPGETRIAETAKKAEGAWECHSCPGSSAPCTHDTVGFKCGLHATNDWAYFSRMLAPYGYHPRHEDYCRANCIPKGFAYTVFGLVNLFGRVIEGPLGWRAEKATVNAIISEAPPGRETLVAHELGKLAQAYNVPLLSFSKAEPLVTPIGGSQ